jgi:hypothetical protein
MGISNIMGGSFSWMSNRVFSPISSRVPRAWRFAGYTLRSPFRLATWGLTGTLHASALYGVHRWQDNIGMVERFRKGKSLRLLPSEWVEMESNGLHVIRSQKVLAQYRADSSKQIEDIKGDEIYHQIHEMKRWIRNLNNGRLNPEQEEQLLGIFWIARACGKLNESAQGHLLKWMKEGRYDRVDQYLFFHQIPLFVSPQERILKPQLFLQNISPQP